MEHQNRNQIYKIIFSSDTKNGKFFDVVIITLILASTILVVLESVDAVRQKYALLFKSIEWIITILFTIEYALRLYSTPKRFEYALSFYGLIDLLTIVPGYLGLLIPESQYFRIIRILRLLRVFRIFKLSEYIVEAKHLQLALLASIRKIVVFLTTVVFIIIVTSAFMYVIEEEEGGFTDIPTSMYWAIVTITTVGYGDIAPETPAGKFLASLMMLFGYSIIAVPTGIVTVELARVSGKRTLQKKCIACGMEGLDIDAKYCQNCGEKL